MTTRMLQCVLHCWAAECCKRCVVLGRSVRQIDSSAYAAIGASFGSQWLIYEAVITGNRCVFAALCHASVSIHARRRQRFSKQLKHTQACRTQYVAAVCIFEAAHTTQASSQSTGNPRSAAATRCASNTRRRRRARPDYRAYVEARSVRTPKQYPSFALRRVTDNGVHEQRRERRLLQSARRRP